MPRLPVPQMTTMEVTMTVARVMPMRMTMTGALLFRCRPSTQWLASRRCPARFSALALIAAPALVGHQREQDDERERDDRARGRRQQPPAVARRCRRCRRGGAVASGGAVSEPVLGVSVDISVDVGVAVRINVGVGIWICERVDVGLGVADGDGGWSSPFGDAIADGDEGLVRAGATEPPELAEDDCMVMPASASSSSPAV